MIVHVLGFGNDDPTDTKIYPHAHLSMKKNVMALTSSGRIVIMGDGANKPTFATALLNGSFPRDIFSMESKVNPNEFLKTGTIKCLGKYCMMHWYRDVCIHSGIWGVYVPQSFYLQVDYPMVSLWDKHHIGANIHPTRGNMAHLMSKLLSNPSMFPHDTVGNTMRDTITINNANGDGHEHRHAALHNIMRSVHLTSLRENSYVAVHTPSMNPSRW
jgi:hypothetical protein